MPHKCGDAAEEECFGLGVAEFVDAGSEGGGEELSFAGVGEGAPGGPGGVMGGMSVKRGPWPSGGLGVAGKYSLDYATRPGVWRLGVGLG